MRRLAWAIGLLSAAGCDATSERPDAGPTWCMLGQVCVPRVGPVAPPPHRPCPGPCGDESERPVPSKPPACPAIEPELGDACTRSELLCSYGEHAYVECRRYLECRGGSWVAPTRLPTVSCEAATIAAEDECPAEPPVSTTGCVIPSVGPASPCIYPDQRCFCRQRFGGPGDPGEWRCDGAPHDPRCPAVLPNLGEGCSHRDLKCDYTAEPCGAHPYTQVECSSGMWIESFPDLCV